MRRTHSTFALPTKILLVFTVFSILLSAGCKKDDNNNNNTSPKLIFKFKFDSTQVRLNNFGQPDTLPAGHAGISPKFNAMSAHYIELAPDAYTQLGAGTVLYKAPETTIGGANAIDFDSSKRVAEGEVFFSVPLDSVKAGTYQWLRVSLSYQNYNITYLLNYPQYGINNQTITGTLASFVGFNTYVRNYTIKDTTVSVNANKLQGYWGFETSYLNYTSVLTGQATATTVPNPIAATSPIPTGSCVVTGEFANGLTITGNETKDIVITVSLSTNKSFEFEDTNGNGQLDVTNNSAERVVDMGVRGLIPIVSQ